MKKDKKTGMGSGMQNKPTIDNDQLGENVYEKYAPDGKPDKKDKRG